MPLFKDEKMVKRCFIEDDLLKEDHEKWINLSVFIPDETKSFKENYINMFKHDLRKETLRKIYELKKEFLQKTGELL